MEFSAEACDKIVEYRRLLVRKLEEEAMNIAAEEKAEEITAEHVEKAWAKWFA